MVGDVVGGGDFGFELARRAPMLEDVAAAFACRVIAHRRCDFHDLLLRESKVDEGFLPCHRTRQLLKHDARSRISPK